MGDSSYVDAAERAATFILNTLHPNKRLLARYREEEAAYLGYLDDYAFVIWGLLELYQATGKVRHLQSNLEYSDLLEMKKAVFSAFRPYSTLLYQEGTIGKLIPWVTNYPVQSDQAAAYICENFSCHKPVNTASELNTLLDQ